MLRERFVQLGEERLKPIAWNKDGQRLAFPFPSSEIVSILVLEDTDVVPEDINFPNLDVTKPLLIVWHKGSDHHKIEQIENDIRVLRWGIPRECANFSHNDTSSDTWNDVQQLVCGDLDPTKFAQKYRSTSFLDGLEKWAAICQLYMIGPATPDRAALGQEVRSTLDALPEQFSAPTWEQYNKAQRDWPALLKQVREYASPLAREPLS